MIVVSGLANSAANEGGPRRFTPVRRRGRRRDPEAHRSGRHRTPASLDQYAAREFGRETRLASLELAVEPNYIVGNCDNGYSCVYQNTFSWKTPTTPLPMENNPRVVFERMFGDGSSPEARRLQMRRGRSILDWVSADMNRLVRTLGPADRTVVTEYLDAVREVEGRIQMAEQQGASSLEATVRLLGVPA